MTLSAQDCWSTYREAVGGTNHDGSHTLPVDVNDLTGERPIKGWYAVSQLANQHATDAIEPVRHRLAESNVKLHNKNFALEKRIKELESDAVAARVVELERCQKILIGTSREHGEILARLQGLQDGDGNDQDAVRFEHVDADVKLIYLRYVVKPAAPAPTT